MQSANNIGCWERTYFPRSSHRLQDVLSEIVHSDENVAQYFMHFQIHDFKSTSYRKVIMRVQKCAQLLFLLLHLQNHVKLNNAVLRK
jgi:hypothetical protein